MRNLKHYFPGSLLILIAILIVAVPEILVALVAASIFMAGILSLRIGHMIRKSALENSDFDRLFARNDPFERWFRRAPVFVRWHRRF